MLVLGLVVFSTPAVNAQDQTDTTAQTTSEAPADTQAAEAPAVAQRLPPKLRQHQLKPPASRF